MPRGRPKKPNQTQSEGGSVLAKMGTLSAFLNACTNQDLIAAFNKIPEGTKLFELFAQAVSDHIEDMMNPNSTEVETASFSAAQSFANMQVAIGDLYRLLYAINNSPIMPVLTNLAAKLGADIPQVQGPKMPEPPPVRNYQPAYVAPNYSMPVEQPIQQPVPYTPPPPQTTGTPPVQGPVTTSAQPAPGMFAVPGQPAPGQPIKKPERFNRIPEVLNPQTEGDACIPGMF